MYREWSTVWQGQSIVVKVWYYNSLFFRLTEELWIGGLLVDRNQICSWLPGALIYERLGAPVSIANRVHHLEISLYYSDKPYCNISIDAEIIGGDVDVNIPRTDLETWAQMQRKGFLHFAVEIARSNMLKIVGVGSAYLIFSSSVYALYHFMNIIPITWEFTLLIFQSAAALMLVGLFFALVRGFMHWKMWEHLYDRTLAHQRKLDAPSICLEIEGVLKDVS